MSRYLVILLMLVAQLSHSGVYDYTFYANKCELTSVVPRLERNALKRTYAYRFVMFCSRATRELVCKLIPIEHDPLRQIKFSIIEDSPPYLVLLSEDQHEAMWVNLGENAAAYNNRYFRNGVMFTKTCSLSVRTHDKPEALKKED